MIELPINLANQEKMATYMRDLFPFNGVDAKQRHEIEKDVWQEVKSLSADELLAELQNYYAQDAREYQYLAIDLAVRAKRKWNREHMLEFLELAKTKMWWDSIDAWRKLFGEYVKIHPEEFAWTSQLFVNHDIFWIRRMGINLQLGFKEKTDTNYLSQMILADLDTDEFFIQKAIGWSLRDYVKYNRQWVIDFVERNNLSTLATKEALKNL